MASCTCMARASLCARPEQLEVLCCASTTSPAWCAPWQPGSDCPQRLACSPDGQRKDAGAVGQVVAAVGQAALVRPHTPAQQYR